MEEEPYEINEELDIAELAAQESLEALYECGAQILYDHYIRDKSVPFAAQQAVSIIGSTVELYYIRQDTGEPEIWEEIPEPSPCVIDPWMRSVVPVKKKFKEPEPDEPSGQSVISVEKSMRSHKSFRSSRSSFKKKTSPTKSTRGFQNNLITEEIKPVPIPNVVSDSSEDEAENQMREMKERQVKRKKEEKERLKQRKEEEAAKEREYQREAEDLKNKMFTYDFGGKIMIVNPINFENVNAYSTSTMKYAVPEPIAEELTMKDKKKKKDRTAVSDFGIIKPKKVPPAKEQEWVRNATSLSASIFDNINLSLGVTIFDGNRSKLPLSSSQSKLKTMSRKEYFGITAREHAFRSTGDLQIAKQESLHSSSASRQNTIYKLPSIASARTNKDLLENIPDNETHAEVEENPQNSLKRAPTEDIPQISVKETPQIILAKSPQLEKIRKYENVENIKEMSPIDKFNVEILKNKNWGLNPPFKGAKLPAKLPNRNISPRQQYGIYGDKIRKPKDNPFASAEELWESQKNSIKRPRDRRFIERVEHKQRMPPPPFGQSMVDYSTLASTIPEMQEKSNN
ncbi:unnamed protein product [Blepharisma stoltei]|uniref:Uncharacterized protein n=1 Tax=Blepharisma stoltei TaxID=1481888 RepID=A0AAU9IGY8_9CILI|nr:unnamed protein product [Blepharisma stoltei]